MIETRGELGSGKLGKMLCQRVTQKGRDMRASWLIISTRLRGQGLEGDEGMRPSEQESGVWARRVGFRVTIVGKADLKVQIKVEAEGNLNGVIKRRSGSLDYMGSNKENRLGSRVREKQI